MNKHKGQSIEEKIKCTDCVASDYLSPAQRERLDAYNDNGGAYEDLPLATRRLLEGQK